MTICSLVVLARPQNIEEVNNLLNAMDGVEVHARNEQGKMVISIDHPSREYCSKAMTNMSHMNGVMSISLVYEYQEDLDIEQDKLALNKLTFNKHTKLSMVQGDVK